MTKIKNWLNKSELFFRKYWALVAVIALVVGFLAWWFPRNKEVQSDTLVSNSLIEGDINNFNGSQYNYSFSSYEQEVKDLINNYKSTDFNEDDKQEVDNILKKLDYLYSKLDQDDFDKIKELEIESIQKERYRKEIYIRIQISMSKYGNFANYNKAIQELLIAKKISEDKFNSNNKEYKDIISFLSFNYWQKGDYDKAIESFKEELNKFGDKSKYKDIAGLYLTKGDYDNAILYYKQGIFFSKMYITDVKQIYHDLGITYLNKGDVKNAVECLSISCSLGSEDYTSCYELGMVFYKLENYDQAFELYNKSLDVMKTLRKSFYTQHYTDFYIGYISLDSKHIDTDDSRSKEMMIMDYDKSLKIYKDKPLLMSFGG